MMRAALAGMAMFAVVAGGAAAQAPSLDGPWVGQYSYDDGATTVEFKATLKSDGDEFAGTTSEPNTIGDKSVAQLTANLSGIIGPNGAVNFVKTYDGSGGVNHSVDYVGYLETSGRCIRGIWHIGDTSGPFRMCAGYSFSS